MKWTHVLMIAVIAMILLAFHKEKKKIDRESGN